MLMVNVGVSSATMELVPLLCLSLLTLSGSTFADENGAVLVAVEEKSDAILPCSFSSKKNITSMVFDWKKDGHMEVFLYDSGTHYNNGRAGQDEQFKGRVFHFKDELKNGNASIKITNTKMADNGSYTCIFPNQQTSQVTLFVGPDSERFVLKDRRKENIQGAAPEPYIKLLKQTKDWALLECLVRGASPTPKLQWQDSSGTIIHSEEPRVSGREVSLQTTVNKSNVYRCVATQDEFKHRIDAEIHVYLGDNQTGWIVAGVLGGLLILAIILLGIKHCHNKL